MIHVDVPQIQAELPRYLERVARGETIVVTRDEEPVAELRPLFSRRKTPRTLGLARGLGELRPSFSDRLPDDVIDSFYGEEP
jgi:antitoxin (DNA-binding transcriptional repressor) of toxin-antitoxin stability system